MVFSSSLFLFVFLPLVLAFYYIPFPQKIRRTYRNLFLLAASLGFYAWGEPVFVIVMLLSISVNYFLARAIACSSHAENSMGGGASI